MFVFECIKLTYFISILQSHLFHLCLTYIYIYIVRWLLELSLTLLVKLLYLRCYLISYLIKIYNVSLFRAVFKQMPIFIVDNILKEPLMVVFLKQIPNLLRVLFQCWQRFNDFRDWQVYQVMAFLFKLFILMQSYQYILLSFQLLLDQDSVLILDFSDPLVH